MKKILSILSILLCVVCFPSCNNDDPEKEAKSVEVTVDSKLVTNPAGQLPGIYMKVTFTATGQVRYIAQADILGFSYKEGNTYRLLIKEMHVANSNEVYYILEKILSETPDPDNKEPLTPIG